MTYFAAALLAVAVGLAVLRVTERRSPKPSMVLHVITGIVVLAVSISSMVQTYRVGAEGRFRRAPQVPRARRHQGQPGQELAR